MMGLFPRAWTPRPGEVLSVKPGGVEGVVPSAWGDGRFANQAQDCYLGLRSAPCCSGRVLFMGTWSGTSAAHSRLRGRPCSEGPSAGLLCLSLTPPQSVQQAICPGSAGQASQDCGLRTVWTRPAPVFQLVPTASVGGFLAKHGLSSLSLQGEGGVQTGGGGEDFSQVSDTGAPAVAWRHRLGVEHVSGRNRGSLMLRQLHSAHRGSSEWLETRLPVRGRAWGAASTLLVATGLPCGSEDPRTPQSQPFVVTLEPHNSSNTAGSPVTPLCG